MAGRKKDKVQALHAAERRVFHVVLPSIVRDEAEHVRKHVGVERCQGRHAGVQGAVSAQTDRLPILILLPRLLFLVHEHIVIREKTKVTVHET